MTKFMNCWPAHASRIERGEFLPCSGIALRNLFQVPLRQNIYPFIFAALLYGGRDNQLEPETHL